MDRQIYILNRIVQLMHGSALESYDELRCEFSYEKYDDSWSVGSEYSFVCDGVYFSKLLDDPGDEASVLIRELHDLMEKHTGGNWGKFLITVDSSGAAKTKFFYGSKQ